MMINPVITHAIAHSAYHGGYRIHKEGKNDAGD
jgi:multisubunit Na+/H+ antiporter MnhG subunit